MANEGYIKLYRRMMKWGWYTDTPTKCVFLHLLFLACYEPCYYKGVQLEPGQAVSSIRQISTDTGISVQSVRTAINHLKSTQEITQCEHGKFSVFTVNNYSDYQCANTEANKQVTQNQHSANTDPYIKKNKEVKNTPYNPPQGDEGVPVSKRFVPPTPEEVAAHCQERHNSIDSKEFCVSSKAAKKCRRLDIFRQMWYTIIHRLGVWMYGESEIIRHGNNARGKGVGDGSAPQGSACTGREAPQEKGSE